MTYIAMGMHTENSVPKTPTCKYFEDRNQAERQYHLFCASAAVSEYETDTAVLMTMDGVTLERKTWHHEQPVEGPENVEEAP